MHRTRTSDPEKVPFESGGTSIRGRSPASVDPKADGERCRVEGMDRSMLMAVVVVVIVVVAVGRSSIQQVALELAHRPLKPSSIESPPLVFYPFLLHLPYPPDTTRIHIHPPPKTWRSSAVETNTVIQVRTTPRPLLHVRSDTSLSSLESRRRKCG